MIKIIGLDKWLLGEVSGNERFMYRLVAFVFVCVVLLSILSNGYFGWMLTASWSGVIFMAILMGFIHFSILRIGIITMISLPLVAKEEANTKASRLRQFMFNVKSFFTMANVVRWIFVGCIAVSMAFPLVSAMRHDLTESLNRQKRMEVFEDVMQHQYSNGQMPMVLKRELLQANYPFFVFRQWISRSSERFFLLFVSAIVGLPFALLIIIKKNKQFSYAAMASERAKEAIKADYAITIEESQYWVDRHFSFYKKSLSSLTPYTDAPFNTILKTAKVREWGTDATWEQCIKGQ